MHINQVLKTLSEEWNLHVRLISHSHSKPDLGFLRRNLKVCPAALKELAYFSLVRSKLEYASATWDPYTVHGRQGTAGQSAAKRSKVCEDRLQVREQYHRDADRPAVGAPGGEEEASNKAAYAGQDNWWKGGN